MSPIWLTSKTPTPPRTALCSATSPPFAGYSTGISQPPKFTIFAPRRRCTPLRGVFRSSGMVGKLTDCIPRAREEIDTNMRPESGQRSPTLKEKTTSREKTRPMFHFALQRRVSRRELPSKRRLAARHIAQVQFSAEAVMPGPVLCSTCDKPEGQCTCEKYCTICKGQHKVRLCADGLYYCPDCREACDVSLANTSVD